MVVSLMDGWTGVLVNFKEQTVMTKEGLKEEAEDSKDICHCPCTAGLDCSSGDNEEMDHRGVGTSAETSDQSSSRPEESDFLPSVRLALVLFFIFSLVSTLLFYSSTPQAPIHRSRRTVRPVPKDYRLEKLRLLFPSQTEVTWCTLERKLDQQLLPDGKMEGLDILFIAVAQGGSRNTLLCLTKNIISVLLAIEQIPVPVRSELAEFSHVHFRWRPQCINEWPVMSIAVVGKRRGGAPCGIHVGIHCSLDRESSIWKTTLRLMPATHNLEDCMIHNMASDHLALKILNSFNRTGRVPDTVWLNSVGSLPVMSVNVEHYLENDFVC